MLRKMLVAGVLFWAGSIFANKSTSLDLDQMGNLRSICWIRGHEPDPLPGSEGEWKGMYLWIFGSYDNENEAFVYLNIGGLWRAQVVKSRDQWSYYLMVRPNSSGTPVPRLKLVFDKAGSDERLADLYILGPSEEKTPLYCIGGFPGFP